MWQLPVMNNEIISIACSSTSLTCSWIQPSRTRSPYILKAYRHTALTKGIIHQSNILNPTALAQHIRSFIHAHTIEHGFVVLSPHNSGLIHNFVRLPTSTVKRDDVTIPGLDKTAWNMHYLYPEDDGQSVFYVCGLPRSLLTQYTLLAAQCGLNLIAITPIFMAHITLYRSLYARAFRLSQLAHDMQKHTNHLENFFTQDAITRLLYTPFSIPQSTENHLSLVTALGLFLLGNSNEEHELHRTSTAR